MPKIKLFAAAPFFKFPSLAPLNSIIKTIANLVVVVGSCCSINFKKWGCFMKKLLLFALVCLIVGFAEAATITFDNQTGEVVPVAWFCVSYRDPLCGYYQVNPGAYPVYTAARKFLAFWGAGSIGWTTINDGCTYTLIKTVPPIAITMDRRIVIGPMPSFT